jgi:4-phospho-D-threonate 3-dehydrogenase / 4-phospho-D-erythronate 3-dehydrogenase
MDKPKIGITVGDINGIGMEVILKTIANKPLLSMCHIIIYGSAKVVAYHKNIVQNLGDIPINSIKSVDLMQDDIVNVVNVWQDNVKIALGTVTEEAGRFSFAALEQATEDLKAGLIDALVTAPIHKKAMQLAEFPFAGHTEYLAAKFEVKNSLMFMVSDTVRIGVATNHIPVQDVARTITRELVLRKIQLMHETLRMDFGIDRPTIAVLGLNPHAGDEGAIGQEEQKFIIPAIEAAKKANILAVGPYPADGFFGSNAHRQFDGILAMYHDQGLIPFKLLAFEAGVNYTAGLPFVRTSPDHGTAYNIVGQNAASPDSLLKAIFLAIDVVQQRANYAEMRSNPLQTIAVDERLFEEDEAL